MRKLVRHIIFIFVLTSCTCAATGQEIKRWKMKDLQEYLRKSESALIVNFWATFCKPCVEEIPYFQTISEKYKDSVKLLLVSLDLPGWYPQKIDQFAKKNGFTAEIVWLDETDADYFCPLIDSSWSGAMPATLILNKGTGYRKFYQQPLKPEFLEARIRESIGVQ